MKRPLILEVRTFLAWKLGSLYDERDAERLAQLALSEALLTTKEQLPLLARQEITFAQAARLAVFLSRLLKGEPFQYITGKAQFRELDLVVNREVLIPRPETEELVEWIAQRYDDYAKLAMLDIGTGSGCIAISLGKLFPKARLTAVDVSPGALDLARLNARRNNVRNVAFYRKNLIQAGRDDFSNLDVIVSNPPYVPLEERDTLHPNVRYYEPPEALFVPEGAPLFYYKYIAKLGRHWLADSGEVYLELHPPYAEAVAECYEKEGYVGVTLKRDLSDRLRFMCARNAARAG